MNISRETPRNRIRAIIQALDTAKTHCGNRLVSCLDGGYNIDVLAESVQAHLEELLASKS